MDLTRLLHPLETHIARKLAVEASVAPRTIQHVYRGDGAKGLAGERARIVLIAHGFCKEEMSP